MTDHTELFARETCGVCGGDGRVKTGEPLGSADGPQYGTCSACDGSGKVYVPVKIVVHIENKP